MTKSNLELKTFVGGTRYIDEEIPCQKYVLVSFLPNGNAKPDSHGSYGWCKVRGVAKDLNEAQELAKSIIKNQDALLPINITTVGRPFPLTPDLLDGSRSVQVETAEFSKLYIGDVSKEALKQKDEEEQERDNIQNRAELLQNEATQEEDPLDAYCKLKTKIISVLTTHVETIARVGQLQSKLKDSEILIRDLDLKILDLNKVNPTFEQDCIIHIDRESDSIGLAKNKNPNMDKLLETRTRNLKNYRAICPSLFEEEPLSENNQ
jgi:hypothetical protein